LELLLLCHAATRAMKTGCFPTGEESADADAGTPEQAPVRADAATRVISSPARAARETAARIAHTFDIDSAFDDLDYGRWRGLSIRTIGEREPQQVAAWLTEPSAHPHGGESIAMLVTRVIPGIARIGRETPQARCIVVTHAIVVKAAVVHALGKPLSSVYGMDFAPLSVTVMTRPPGADAWTVSLPPAPA
jgi:broad specificity phosphatase PhoE